MKITRLKLAKMLLKFGEVESDKGTLSFEGELAEGTEVFQEVDGELQPATDGDYQVEGDVITVEAGVIKSITKQEEPAEPEVEVEAEEVEPEAEVPAEDPRIAELEIALAEALAQIEVLNAEIAELKKEPVEASIRMSVENTKNISAKEIKANPALKYFQK